MDEQFLSKIINLDSKKLDFILHYKNHNYSLENVKITKSQTPVNRPTTRGGIYFSDTFDYKIQATVSDPSIIPLLSECMLGPNTEFKELEISTNAQLKDYSGKITFFVHITNSMQNSSKIELNMKIVRINFNQI